MTCGNIQVLSLTVREGGREEKSQVPQAYSMKGNPLKGYQQVYRTGLV
jgi:hypothetical protein